MFSHINYIYEVYKERSFSKAAKNLYITQSALSITIKKAEDKIGMPIFDRTSFPISLTEFGKEYIAAATQIMALENKLNSLIYKINNLKHGHLAIGTGTFLVTYLAAPVVSIFKQHYPNIGLDLVEGRTLDLLMQLEKNNIDILITNGKADLSIYTKYPLLPEHLTLAVPKQLLPSFLLSKRNLQTYSLSYQDLFDAKTIAQKPGVPLKLFNDVPFIGMRSGNDTRIRADKIFSYYDVSPQSILELDQTYNAYALCCNGMGACIVSDCLLRHMGEKPNLIFFKLDHPATTRQVSIYVKTSLAPTRTIQEFIGIAQDYCNTKLRI